jgi:hypothetical protein
VEECSIHGE